MIQSSIAIQVLPKVEKTAEVVRIVDAVIAYIKSTGLTVYVGPFETTVEGDFDLLMDIVKNCQLICIREGAPSVMSYVKISYATEGILTIHEKVDKHHG